MKTTILANGTLTVTPESEFEAYALNQWGQANLNWQSLEAYTPKMISDCSDYAEKLGLFVEIPLK
jgi:hypothetical protein